MTDSKTVVKAYLDDLEPMKSLQFSNGRRLTHVLVTLLEMKGGLPVASIENFFEDGFDFLQHD